MLLASSRIAHRVIAASALTLATMTSGALGQDCPRSDHDCSTPGGPGCTDVDCCSQLCALDPKCCDVAWDQDCVDEAAAICSICGNTSAGSCCSNHKTPFCDDADCCNAVCKIDSFCCDFFWDTICASEAALFPECECTFCPPSDHNCFTEGVPGCTDKDCCSAVCQVDGFCCDAAWDGVCVDEAIQLCDGCGDPNAGSCCSGKITPFCEDRACCQAVCARDGFCCEVRWDDICAAEAAETPECDCGVKPCFDPQFGPCFAAHDNPFCEDCKCWNIVCFFDEFCCATAWDQTCANEAVKLCGGCGAECAGSCFAAHAGTGCENPSCCGVVCAINAACCDTAWDEACAKLASSTCCLGDLDGNGAVDGADLGLLLANWDEACLGDINGDGSTDGADLGLLLSNWGFCGGPA